MLPLVRDELRITSYWKRGARVGADTRVLGVTGACSAEATGQGAADLPNGAERNIEAARHLPTGAATARRGGG